MTQLALLTGNPGHQDDFAALAAALEARELFVTRWTRPPAGAPIAALSQEISERAPGLPVIAYSFGAFVALHHAARQRERGEAPPPLALLAPYLVPDSPTSPVVRALAAAPGIGRWLLGRKAAGLTAAYLRNVFAPELVPASFAEAATRRMASAACWRGALRYKREMELHPAPPLAVDGPPLLWVRGAEDRVAEVEAQQALLAPARARTREVALEGAGHGLPWTRTTEVADEIERWARALETGRAKGDKETHA